MPEIISRKEARALGLVRYFTGSPCLRGHVSERALASGQCMICANLKHRDFRKRHPGKSTPVCREWKCRHPERVREYDKKRKDRARLALEVIKQLGVEI